MTNKSSLVWLKTWYWLQATSCYLNQWWPRFIVQYGIINPQWVLTRQIWGIWKLRPAYSSETPNLGQNRWCFVLCDLEIWWMTLENNRASLLCCFKLCVTFHSHRWIPETANLGQIRQFLEPCDLEIWRMTLKNNRAPLQCYFKLFASFRSHWCIQTWVTVRKRPIWVKFDDF